MEAGHPSLEVMHRMFDEGFAVGNDAIVDELCSPDLVEHQFGLAGAGAAVPDMRFTIEDSVIDGDRVWVRVRACGNNSGPFFGPPSDQPVDITVFDQARILDGRIVEHWGVPDRFALLAQTGVLARMG